MEHNVRWITGLLLEVPNEATLVAFANNVVEAIMAKHLSAEHKTEVVLIASRKVAETITLEASDYEHTCHPFIRNLGVKIDAQLRHSESEPSYLGSCLMLKDRSKGEDLYCHSVATFVLMYGIPIWVVASMHKNRITLTGEYPKNCYLISYNIRGCSKCYRQNATLSDISRRAKVICRRKDPPHFGKKI